VFWFNFYNLWIAMEKIIKCPNCGEPMEKGFIATWYMFWTGKKQEVFWKAPPREDVVVKPGVFHIFDSSREAYRCRKCELVLFNYRDVTISETPRSFLKECVKCAKKIPIASEYCPVCGTRQKEEGKQS